MQGVSLIPGWGIKVPHDVVCAAKKRKKNINKIKEIHIKIQISSIF